MQRVIALQYHDVVEHDDFDASGFAGPDAATYKLRLADFAAHVRAVSAVVRPDAGGGVVRGDALPAVCFTFDDGGVSALTHAAGVLEASGWRGHFFVTTDYIGTRGFLDPAQLRELHARGHVIGAHSCSHPVRMARCTDAELAREWGGSVAALAGILGAPPAVASVPGGYYARRVAEAAAAAGLRVLFTSEPVTTVGRVAGCTVAGRYTLRRGSAPAEAAALAAGARLPRWHQWTAWNGKKLVKRVAGDAYLQVRLRMLR